MRWKKKRSSVYHYLLNPRLIYSLLKNVTYHTADIIYSNMGGEKPSMSNSTWKSWSFQRSSWKTLTVICTVLLSTNKESHSLQYILWADYLRSQTKQVSVDSLITKAYISTSLTSYFWSEWPTRPCKTKAILRNC